MLSYQVVAVTVGWHIYEVTRNPFSLGLVGLAEVLPFFCVAPFAGYLVDHLPRRRLGMVACSGLIATALVLTSVAKGWLPFEGVWPIYAAIALTGMVRAFLSPIYNALFARVLARDQFARGAGLGAVVFQAGMVAGPALGGVLVGFGGKGLSYAVATVFALVAMGCLATLKEHRRRRALRGGQPDHGRRDGAGHVLGAAVWRGGDAAGVPARNPAPRPGRAGHPARDAGAGFGMRGAVAGPPPTAPQCRPRAAVRGGRLRPVRDRLRAVAALLAGGADPAVLRGVRRRVGGDPLDHPAAGHAGGNARTGVVDQRHLHQFVQRTGRVLRRHDGAAAGPGAGGGAGWVRGAERGRDHGVEEPDAAEVESSRPAVAVL
ncbi:hypothetical protein G6F24_013668 [Rhizopus arrhizus]|nr:hypothetical protein G6F24_013668 [Rhizopus arrhizus]